MKHLLRSLTLILAVGTTAPLMAQNLHTNYFMETSKYRHQMNPAFLENAPYISIPFLGNTAANIYSDIDFWSIRLAITSSNQHNPSLNSFISINDDSKIKLGDWQGGVAIYYNLASVAFNAFGGTNLIEVNLGARMDAKFHNQLLHPTGAITPSHAYELTQVSSDLNAYSELALGHARRIGNHFTFGAKAKLLIGAIDANLEVEELRMTLDPDKWIPSGHNSGIIGLLKDSYNLNQENTIGLYNAHKTKGYRAGIGFGLDLGMTYRVHGFEDLTLSLGITDIGLTQHNTDNTFKNNSGEWLFNGFDSESINSSNININQVDHELDLLKRGFDTILNTPIREVKALKTLASTVNVGAEYTLPSYRKLSFGALYSHRLAGAYSTYQAMLMTRIRPLKFIEIGVSASKSTFNTNIGAVLTLQAPRFQFFFGSDYLLQEYTKQDTPSTNINFGFTIPLRSRK